RCRQPAKSGLDRRPSDGRRTSNRVIYILTLCKFKEDRPMADAAEDVNARIRDFFPGTIGVRVTEASPDRVVAAIDVNRGLCTVPGVMHGGAIMALADTLGGVATSLNLQPGYGTT